MIMKSMQLALAASLLAVHQATVGASPLELSRRDNPSDCPGRTFDLTAQQTVGSLLGTIAYFVTVDIDGTKFDEITSCWWLLGWHGAGCKWRTAGTANLKIKDKSWDIKHSGYTATQKQDKDVEMSGDGCDKQVQHCKSGILQQCYPDPEGKSVTCIVDNLVSCNQNQALAIQAEEGKKDLTNKDALSDTDKALVQERSKCQGSSISCAPAPDSPAVNPPQNSPTSTAASPTVSPTATA